MVDAYTHIQEKEKFALQLGSWKKAMSADRQSTAEYLNLIYRASKLQIQLQSFNFGL
jgi:hypothetical protein